MRRAALATVLLLAGCDVQNRFEVVVIDPGATFAAVEICGRPPKTLPRTTTGFELHDRADCQGSGQVVVSFEGGRAVTCPIKIVGRDLAAWYRYRLEGGVCLIA